MPVLLIISGVDKLVCFLVIKGVKEREMTTPRDTQSVLRYAGLATQWIVMLLVAAWAGIKVDGWLKWKIPVCTILFPLVALIYSFWRLINELGKPKK